MFLMCCSIEISNDQTGKFSNNILQRQQIATDFSNSQVGCYIQTGTGHKSKGSLVRIHEWPYLVQLRVTYEKLFNVVLIHKTNHYTVIVATFHFSRVQATVKPLLKHSLPLDVILKTHYFQAAYLCPSPMRPDSFMRFWRYINHSLTHSLTDLLKSTNSDIRGDFCSITNNCWLNCTKWHKFV